MMHYKSFEVWKHVLKDLTIEKIEIQATKYNQAYESFDFNYKNRNIVNRLAKKTPNKKGYFVTVWKKDGDNNNIPLDTIDIQDLLVINIIDEKKIGQFIFNQAILIEKRILNNTNQKGKMAFRIYPPWEKELNQSAKKTQAWQSEYFLDLTAPTTQSFINKFF
ncbi:MepB family protein [Macrococcus animalis]